MRNVASGVVGIEQVLKYLACAASLQMNQAESLFVKGVLGTRTVAVVDTGALPLGIVINVGDAMQIGRRRIKQGRWFGGLPQPGIHPFQQIGLVVTGADDVYLAVGLVAVRRNHLDRPIERVIVGAAGEDFGFHPRL